VASLALNFLGIGMGPSEGEVRPFVIERLLRDRGDILCSTLVVRVAFLAVPLFLESAVGALFGVDILSHVFMTIEAESVLRRFIEPLMALGAIIFPLGMALDHLARHKGGFDSIGPGVTQEGRPESQGDERHMADEGLHRVCPTQYMYTAMM
jgi:hypothetical protein